MALLYHLAGRLYNRRVAAAALVVVLATTMHREVQPLIMGRQVLAEPLMLLYLLAGYAFLLAALRKSAWFMGLAVVCWGLGLVSKAQPLPFWAVSLLAVLGWVLFRRRWREAVLLGVGLVGALAVAWSLPRLWPWLLGGHTLPRASVQGLYSATAIVTITHLRLSALWVTLIAGLPTLLGVCYVAWKWIKHREQGAFDLEIVRLSLLALVGSWQAWYLFLSPAWLRYLFPAIFVGSIFVAALLDDVTEGLQLQAALDRVGRALRRLRFDRQSALGLVVLVFTCIYVPLTVANMAQFFAGGDRSPFQVAEFLNAQTAPDSMVETYDAELFFLVEQPYHYPPDQLHVELIRRTFLGQHVPIDYDPLAEDPDYLVVGPFGNRWGLYTPVLGTGAFRLLRTVGGYRIYERVR